MFKVDKGRKVVMSRQTTTINGEDTIGELGETNGTDTRNAPWAKESHWSFTVSQLLYWGHISWKKLTFRQTGHRFIQCTPGSDNVGREPTCKFTPIPTYEIPAELRELVYRELLNGGGRMIVVMWPQSCEIEGLRVHGKDITSALLRANRRIYTEALPILDQ